MRHLHFFSIGRRNVIWEYSKICERFAEEREISSTIQWHTWLPTTKNVDVLYNSFHEWTHSTIAHKGNLCKIRTKLELLGNVFLFKSRHFNASSIVLHHIRLLYSERWTVIIHFYSICSGILRKKSHFFCAESQFFSRGIANSYVGCENSFNYIHCCPKNVKILRKNCGISMFVFIA